MNIQTAKARAAKAGCYLTWNADSCSATRFTPACRGYWTLCISTDNPDWSAQHPYMDILSADLKAMSAEDFQEQINKALTKAA